MRVEHYTDVERFRAVVWPLLAQQEAENNLLLGVLAGIQRGVYENPLMVAALHGDTAVMVALRTPPRHLLFSTTDHPAALAPLLETVYTRNLALPGVIAPIKTATRAAEDWAARTGGAYTVGMEMRIYKLEQVTAPTGIPGAARLATQADHDLIYRWMFDFQAEALNETLDADVLQKLVAQRLQAEPGVAETLLWEVDGEVVSMAYYSGGPPNGCRVSGVYTPPKHRRHGYGSAITAAVSQRVLDAGKSFCFLFTDLANPTSNSIYQQIGYHPVVGVNRIDFTEG